MGGESKLQRGRGVVVYLISLGVFYVRMYAIAACLSIFWLLALSCSTNIFTVIDLNFFFQSLPFTFWFFLFLHYCATFPPSSLSSHVDCIWTGNVFQKTASQINTKTASSHHRIQISHFLIPLISSFLPVYPFLTSCTRAQCSFLICRLKMSNEIHTNQERRLGGFISLLFCLLLHLCLLFFDILPRSIYLIFIVPSIRPSYFSLFVLIFLSVDLLFFHVLFVFSPPDFSCCLCLCLSLGLFPIPLLTLYLLYCFSTFLFLQAPLGSILAIFSPVI